MAEKDPKYIEPKRAAPRHIVIKLSKVKEKILKAEREKWLVTYKGTPIRLLVDFSTETLQARRQWDDIFKILEKKKSTKTTNLQKWKRDKHLPKSAKIEGVHDH